MHKERMIEMKKGVLLVFTLLFLFVCTGSYAMNTDEVFLQSLYDALALQIPMDSYSITENASGTYTLDYTLSAQASVDDLFMYSICARAKLLSYMEQGLDGFAFHFVDENGADRLVLSSEKIYYCKVDDYTGGTLVTSEYETPLDLWQAYPYVLPETSDRISAKGLALLKTLTDKVTQNPNLSAVSMLESEAVQRSTNYDGLLLTVNTLFAALCDQTAEPIPDYYQK